MQAVSYLPEWIVSVTSITLFLVGAVVLLRAALLTVSGLAVIAGRILLRYLRLSLLHYVAASVCLLFAGVGVYGLATG